MPEPLIDVSTFSDRAVLIVCRETGVRYYSQAGGMACYHPEAEGFAIPLFNPVEDVLDDHEYGCDRIHASPELQRKLADALDSALKAETERYTFSLRFDYDRIDDLMEGWWPVIVSGTISSADIRLDNARAYLATGNCD